MNTIAERRSGPGAGDVATATEGRGFSEREVRILSLVGQGYTATEIIEILQAGRRADDPQRPFDSALRSVMPEGRSAAVLVLAALMTVAIVVADLIFGGEGAPLMFLLVVPVAVLALQFAAVGGLFGAAIASALLAVTALGGNEDLSMTAFLAQVAAFGLTAVVVGVMSARLHVLRRELDVAERKAGLGHLLGAVEAAGRPEGSPDRRRR